MVLICGAGGWLTAVGGAWKDAPVEGFSGWKFLRSPVVATFWALVLCRFTDDWVMLAVAAGGWSVISIETYKTFLTGGRPPGKFAGRPVRFAQHEARETCRAVHIAVYGVLALGLADALSASLVGRSGWPSEQVLGLLVVSLMAVAAGVLVLVQPRRPSPTAEPERVR